MERSSAPIGYLHFVIAAYQYNLELQQQAECPHAQALLRDLHARRANLRAAPGASALPPVSVMLRPWHMRHKRSVSELYSPASPPTAAARTHARTHQ